MYKLIVADSNRRSAELIKQCLETQNYNILISETGANILAKSRIFAPDLLILSVNLKDISGYDVCKMVKRDKSTQDIIVLMIGEDDTREFRIKALESGADDFIDKSFDALLLTAKVKSLLRLKSLSNQLKDKYSELEEKNRMIELQLEMAKNVQSSLIKEIDIKVNGLAITSKYMPAIAVGGDFYDVIPLNDKRVLLIMGDVSGHGISAALLTSMMKIMIKNLPDYYDYPDKLLFELNAQFNSIFDYRTTAIYACVFAAIIDTVSKTITYSNAGHPAPIYLNNTDKYVRELDLPGTPTGLITDTEYGLCTLIYRKNDLLLLFTDGLPDGFYKDDPEKFYDTAADLLMDTSTATANSAIINQFIAGYIKANPTDAEKFETDDVSIIVCRL